MAVPEYRSPITTVDAVLLTLNDGVLCVGLLQREQAPCAGMLALPGGYVHVQEDGSLHDAADRILREKAWISSRYLEQLGTFSGATRDPRGWSLSVVYYALMPVDDITAASSMLVLRPVADLPELAFDHADIIKAAVDRLRGRSAYVALPAFLLPPLFTMTELHRVYEQVLGTRLDRASFRRKVAEQAIVDRVDGDQRTGAHRPAALYRMTEGQPHPFQRRI